MTLKITTQIDRFFKIRVLSVSIEFAVSGRGELGGGISGSSSIVSSWALYGVGGAE